MRTLKKAIEAASVHKATIVCMQSVDLSKEDAKTILDYDDTTKTYRLAPEDKVEDEIKIENWSATRLPIVRVADGTTLYIKNIAINSQVETESTLHSGDQLIEVANKGCLQLAAGAQITGGYVGLTFDNTPNAAHAPAPIQVMDNTASANIYCFGIGAAPQWYATKLVTATAELITQCGGEQATGEHLLKNFDLETANKLLVAQGGVSEVAWSLIQGAADADSNMIELQSLYLFTQLNYKYLYVDPDRGDDTNLGITCAFPFKTLSKALAVVEAQQKTLLQMRTDLKDTLTKAELDEKYPLPSVIYACSPIKVTSDEQWDWSKIQNFADEAGELHTITLQAHEEPGLKEGSTSALHSVPNFIVQVSNGATLQMGKDVRIVRQLTLDQVQNKTGDTTSQLQSREAQVTCNRNAVNVIGNAKLVLQENATLMGLAPEGLPQDSYTFRTNPGNGIVVGTSSPTLSYTYPSSGGSNADTLEIDAGWNGQLTGFGRGIYAAGQGTTVTMNGGTIEGNRSGQEGAGIYLVNNANFEMNGGTIQNNTAYYSGAGVYAQNNATVQINKGTIQKNKVNIGNSYIYQGSSSYTSSYSWYVRGGAGLFARSSATITIGKENGNNDDCLIQNNMSNGGSVYGIGVGAQRASIVMNSGTIQNNYPDVSGGSSNGEYGAGIGIFQAKQLKILGGLIQNNGRQGEADSTAMRYLNSYGGGIFVQEDASFVTPQGVTIKNVKISGNKACYGGGIYSKSYWANSGRDLTYDHKVLIQNVEIDSNIARLYGGGIYTTSGDTYKNTVGLLNVIVTNNKTLGVYSGSAGGGIYGGFTWAKGLTVKDNSAETNAPINYTSQGGGIYLTNISTAYYNGTTYYGKDIVMEDCVIESNKAQGQGGGIYNNSAASDSKSNRFGLTLTGTTSVTKNTAEGPKGMGGGIYNSSPLTLNAAVEWNNTAEGISDNTNGTPAGSNIYTNTSDEVRLLQGTFVGNTSIVGYRSDTTVGKIVLDPTKVNFQPEENGYAIHSENPRTQIVLLQPLPAGKALPISINHKNFQPGSLLVVPANVTEISTSALKENVNAEVGGIEVDNTQKITYQNACKDASVNSSSISVSAQPSRAQFAPVPDTKDTTLTNMGFVGEGVYLDGENGDDSNTGLSPAAAVKTFDVAKQRLRTYAAEENRADGFRPVIWVCGTVTISGDTEMTLAQADVDAAGLQRYIDAEKRDNRTPDKVSVQRYAPMNDRPMFKVTDGTLTLKNIKLNGNAESVTAPGSSVIAPIVMLSGKNVNLNIQDGARLYNNLSTALVYVTNAKSITVNQTYATTEKDPDNDEKYGAQLDASQNKNGTVCSYLIYGKDLPQVVDITLSGTAWLNMAGTYFSGSYRSDAQGIYINSGAGANVTLKDNAKISGITSSNGSRQYAVYIGSPTKKVAFLMQGAAEIQYVRYGLYLSNPRQGCTIEMRDTAEVQYVNSGLYLYGPYGNSTISLKNNANIKYATDYAIIKSYSGNTDSKTTITLSENAQVYTSASGSYGIYVNDYYQNNKTKVDLINNSSVNGYSAGICLEGSSTAAAITMSDSAYVNYLYDKRTASTARASLVMNDTAKLGRLYRYYMGSMDVTMFDQTQIVLYKPVFVNGETGKDPTSINMNTGAVTAASGVNTTDLGRRPDNPVKTLDAAILIGQAPDSVEGGSWGSQHNTYLNYYIVYATGSVHNELYKGNYTLPTSGYYTAGKIKVPNKVAGDITYSMDTPAYMARYTGFDVITNSGETVNGESQYNYDHLLDLTNNGNVTLQNIEIYGRRLTDGTDKAGEALVRISDGVTLTMLDNTVLANNFANGSRPTGEDLPPSPMTMKGGAVRIEAGGTLTMAGGRINNTQAVYGNAIYVNEVDNKVGTVMLQNKPQIDGSIYLVGNKTVVNADKSYLPASGVNIALQHDYSGREVAVMTDGTKMDSEHQKLFGLTDSIRALYEVKPKEDEPHKLLLFLKSVYYIDPNISDTVTNRDGMTADTAFKTLDELYDALKVQQGLNGVMVYVVNPITVEKGETVKLINASKTSGVVRKYYSLYTNILGETKKTETQVYFKRYVQPKLSEGGTVPTGFTAASNKSMIFDVQGTLTLKGIYLDGHSRELEDAQKNWTEEALVAEAPLVRVEAGGSLICDAQGETIDNINMEVAATIFTNSTNNKAKTQLLPTAPGIVEGCSAGLEILSNATAEGSATLQKAEFTNLVLDNSKETFVGGAAIYVNGKLIAGEQTFIEDTVYLEGQGKAGTDDETVKLQQTSRYITISKQGTPFNAAFTVLMRDAYNGRLVVRYPAANITIPDDNLSKHRCTRGTNKIK